MFVVHRCGAVLEITKKLKILKILQKIQRNLKIRLFLNKYIERNFDFLRCSSYQALGLFFLVCEGKMLKYSIRSSANKAGLGFLFVCAFLGLNQSKVFADEIIDAALVESAQMLKQTGQKAFHGFHSPVKSPGAGQSQTRWVKGYQAFILSQLCSEVYGKSYSGEFPPIMVSGLLRPLGLRDQFKFIAKRCEKSGLVSELLTDYWYETGSQVETFLSRVSRLAMSEPVIFYDDGAPNLGGTAHTERAIREGADSHAIAAAIKKDTVIAVIKIFGDLNKIHRSILQRIEMVQAMKEALSEAGSEGTLADLLTRLAFLDE